MVAKPIELVMVNFDADVRFGEYRRFFWFATETDFFPIFIKPYF